MAVNQTLTLTQVSQSILENKSKVNIQWATTQTGASYNNHKRVAKYYISINGGPELEYAVAYQLPKAATYQILNHTIDVPHRADGTGTIKVRTWMDTNISAGVVEKSSTLTLTPIPRATQPTLYASTVDMGGTATIYLYRADSSFKHDLSYSVAGGAYQAIASNLDTVHYWAVPDLAAQIPNNTSLTVTIKCDTKVNGVVIGSATVLLTARVPASVAPTISSVALAEATPGVAAQFGAFVKDKSALTVNVAAAGVKGSTIKSYSTTILGRIYGEASFTSEVLDSFGEVVIAVTVTDTRGRSTRTERKIVVLDYFLPVTSEFIAYRTDEDGNAKSDGNYLTVAYAYKVALVNNRNIADMRIDYKLASATSWSTTPLLTGNSLEGAGVIKFEETFTSDYQFDIRMTVTDWFGEEATYVTTLPTANVILDIKADGKGLAFGKTSEVQGFEVAMPPSAWSAYMVGVRDYELGDGFGYILYNNGLLLQWGTVALTPTAINTVVQMEVVFPKAYKTRPHITGTLLANSPQVVDWGMGVGTTAAAGLSRLVIYMTRATLHATTFRWMAVGMTQEVTA